jgi:hypothetical protein
MEQYRSFAMVSRRRFLVAVTAGAALGGIARPAGAFRIQEASDDLKAVRFSGCGAGAGTDGGEHDRLRAEIARLLGEPQLPAAERDRLNRGVACPLCGGMVGPGC